MILIIVCTWTKCGSDGVTDADVPTLQEELRSDINISDGSSGGGGSSRSFALSTKYYTAGINLRTCCPPSRPAADGAAAAVEDDDDVGEFEGVLQIVSLADEVRAALAADADRFEI